MFCCLEEIIPVEVGQWSSTSRRQLRGNVGSNLLLLVASPQKKYLHAISSGQKKTKAKQNHSNGVPISHVVLRGFNRLRRIISPLFFFSMK